MRSTLIATAAAIALMLLPGVVVAQEDVESPEDRDWHLVAMSTDGEQVDVPVGIVASLSLSGGEATGSTGCNQFTGEYGLDDDSLTFGTLTQTDAFCGESESPIEAAYLSALAESVSLEAFQDSLWLYDAGTGWLEFEPASVPLTSSQLDVLLAQIVELESRLGELTRDGIRERESLQDRITKLEEASADAGQVPKDGPSQDSAKPAAFDSAEMVLLKAIPTKIRKTCEPRRDALPDGSIAAVQCKPDTPVVRDMAYYLLDSSNAEKVMNERFREYGMARRYDSRCDDGTPGRIVWVGGGYEELGCYIDANGRANLRIAENPAGCSQLRVDGKLVREPSLYIAVLGEDDDITKLREWQEGGESGPGGAITRTIKQKNVPASPSCPS